MRQYPRAAGNLPQRISPFFNSVGKLGVSRHSTRTVLLPGELMIHASPAI
jgi:hypothetical protein